MCMCVGANAYSCSVCGSKQPAHKGLALASLPYVLALQLKRFDMNWDTGTRIKIMQHIRIPEYIYCKPYTQQAQAQHQSSSSSSSLSPSSADADGDPQTHPSSVMTGDVDDGFMYELYSILMHTGSATGGHYFAYIKVNVTRHTYVTPTQNDKHHHKKQNAQHTTHSTHHHRNMHALHIVKHTR